MYELIADDHDFCIQINVPVILKIPKTENNRKLLAVFLRLIYVLSSKNLFTYQTIANFIGLNDRRDIDNYFREFKSKGYDFWNLLARKVDFSKYIEIIQKMVIENPFLTFQELFLLFKNNYPSVKMSISTFSKYLSQTNTVAILHNMHKHLRKTGNSWNEDSMLAYLIQNSENPVVKKRIEEMQKPSVNTKPDENATQIKLSTMNKSLLVKFLVGANLSYQMIAFILGMSKSNVRKLVYRDPYFHQTLLNSIARYSGIICVDEKYVKLNGEFLFVFSAVDGKTGIPLLVELFPKKNAQSWQIFFEIFKKHYGTPVLIVSDGCQSLAKGRKAVFPKVSFQFCKFHKMKNLIRKIYENEKDLEIIKKHISKLKQVFSRKTVGGRRKAFLELEEMLSGNAKEYFNKKLKKQWKHLTKSLTSNAAERWNRKIKKIVSGKYGLKTPETIKQLVNCLWFREVIMNGKAHLNSESIIANINITKECQERISNEQMEQLFNAKACKKVS